MPPYFRPSTALLNCDKETLRWPGPFDTGFLSPQPPGVAGIGSIAVQIIPYWANASWSFFFFRHPLRCCSTLAADTSAKSLASHADSNPGISPTSSRHISVAEPLSSHS